MTSPSGQPGLDAATLAAWATGRRGLDLRSTEEQLARVREGQQRLRAAREVGVVYGLSTGVGALRTTAVPETEGPETALRLWRSHAGGLGLELDDATARATMAIRWRQLLDGTSGVGADLVLALEQALAAGCVPRLHEYGGLGSGDLTVLAELALTLAGELPWRSTEGRAPAPVTPSATDGLPFLSSNAATAAFAALAADRLAGLAAVALPVAAVSHLGLRGSPEAYAAEVFAGRPGPAADTAATLRRLLAGSPVNPARVQDPFCLRTIPQTHGPLLDGLAEVEAAVTEEISSARPNPLVTEAGVHHHGQFLTQRLAAALDGARAAAYPVLALSAARVSALQDPQLTGLPAFLAAGPPGSAGLMIVEYVATDLLARARAIAAPDTTGRVVVSLGVEEHASFSSQAALSALELADLARDLLGVELVTGVRAARLAPERVPAGEVGDLVARADWAHEPADHVLGPELRAASALVEELARHAARRVGDTAPGARTVLE
ncbi:aromatic amino acid lyase [Nocardioides rotundus]|uniref:aromatic amino acid lyase n=1 Tax=Nocardioides rotundus TaxID=1774216 RepID=UPI001CBC94D9|nr:aromatic amino acid lyase [Nocardioides rotundus]UAL30260.1 aromatic amino acid lyase [Nocardioides rotundus]